MPGQHAFLPPSGAKAWSVCALWPSMNQLYPQDDTQESLEGTAAHWVLEQVFKGIRPAEGSLTPNGQVVTREMLDGADLFMQAVNDRLAMHSKSLEASDFMGNVETRVAMPRIHLYCWGTTDFWFYIHELRILENIDYKFGHGYVDEFENPQIVLYGEGLIEMLAKQFGMLPLEFEHGLSQINLSIVQPRCYYNNRPVRTWSTNAYGIKHIREKLIVQAHKAFEPTPEAVPNDECKHCPGRHACGALQKVAYEAADYALRTLPYDLTAEQLSREAMILRKALDRLNARVEGIEETLLTKLKQGGRAPFHGVTHPHGRTRWSKPKEEILALGSMFKVDLTKEVEVVTPNQAIERGLSKDLVKSFSEAPTGQAKLVQIDASDARRVFGFRNQPTE